MDSADNIITVWNYSLFRDEDIENYKNGNLYNTYHFFGNYEARVLDREAYYFAVWAPHATAVSVTGNFNGWDKRIHPLFPPQVKWPDFLMADLLPQMI